MKEAIQSVFAQTYRNWELFLVDDGSSGPDSELAQSYPENYPGQIFYLEHAGHINRGQSASRNLGIKHANGELVAFLDSDDIWLPEKLETQVRILETHPEVGMAYANTMYWYSWTGKPEDTRLDFSPELGIEPDNFYEPPVLLPLFLSGKVAVPCINSLLVRLEVLERIGGYVESFRTPDEDQAFYAKLCLSETIYVSNECLDWYRQHPSSVTAVARHMGTVFKTRLQFLLWLKDYLTMEQVEDSKVWKALQREIWRISSPGWLPENSRLQRWMRWVKKWILKSEERLLPESIRDRLWARG